MPVPRIRTDYGSLGRMARGFKIGAEATDRSLQKLRGSMNTLQNGDWIGQGARAAIPLPPQARWGLRSVRLDLAGCGGLRIPGSAHGWCGALGPRTGSPRCGPSHAALS